MSAGRIAMGNGVTLERAVRCTLADRCTLISDHYYPPTDRPAPTLLMRQPYGRDIASTVVYAHPAWFASHGYNVVIQDVRGRGDSDGEFYPFRHERADGAETIAWLRARPESNGRVGMYGFSYQGATQLLAAAAQPEGLECIAPAMTACDLYHGWFYHHGALRLASTIGWGLQMLRADARRRGLTEAHEALEAAWLEVRTQPLFAPYAALGWLQAEGLPTYLRDWLEHTEAGEYWAALDVSTSLDRITIPALHVSGWYDTYLKGSVDGFLALSKHKHQYLLAGPWQHIPWGPRIGDSNFGADAALDTDALLLRWFNHWLKDSGEFAGEPRVRHFALGAVEQGASRWHRAVSLDSGNALTLYLGGEGRANSSKGDGVLSSAAPRHAVRDHFVYDPEVPVTAAPGPSDQAVLEQGNNLLVYTSAPLRAPVHILGSPVVALYAATSAPLADFTAKLVRLTPAGRAEFLSIGIARSSYLFPEYSSDSVRAWRFQLEPTSAIFAAGDSIRLEVAGCAFPLYDRNPSTAEPARNAGPRNWRRSTHSLLHGPAHPSHLELPLTA
jgi:putative CocE/NonD family hydrolase